MVSRRAIFPLLILGATPLSARADTVTLPYSSRFLDYNGWSSTVRGDLRHVGMAGASVGLADTWSGSMQNPAGLAMTLDGSGLQINSNEIRDGDLQNAHEPILTGNVGAFANPYPWGFSLGYWSPHSESAPYVLPATGRTAQTSVSVKEFRMAASRILLDNALSVGASLSVAQARKELRFDTDPSRSINDSSFGVGLTLGAQWQFQHRIIVGASWSPPVSYGASPDTSTATPDLPGFFRTIRQPSILGLGAGIIPSRNFKAGASLQFIGTTQNTALLSNQTRLIGEGWTAQPHVGAFYRVIDTPQLEVNVSAGSYLENTRIQDTPSRLHGTLGLEVNPWIVNVGFGLDRASQYENLTLSAGIDVIRAMRATEIIPPDQRTVHSGRFPDPTLLSDRGLPRPLVTHWDGGGSPDDLLEIGRKIPQNLEHKLRDATEEFQKLLEPKAKRKKPKYRLPINE